MKANSRALWSYKNSQKVTVVRQKSGEVKSPGFTLRAKRNFTMLTSNAGFSLLFLLSTSQLTTQATERKKNVGG